MRGNTVPVMGDVKNEGREMIVVSEPAEQRQELEVERTLIFGI